MPDHPNREQPPPDPSGIDEPHDVLAAEEFVIGTRDDRLPPDPSGIEEPHDVLAAEEFAMPSPEHHDEPGGSRRGPRVWVPALALALGALMLLLRRRSS